MSSCLALATFLLQYFVPFSCCFCSSELITLLACLVEAEAVRPFEYLSPYTTHMRVVLLYSQLTVIKALQS